MKLKRRLRNCALIGLLGIASNLTSLRAEHPFRGAEGPTDFQLDNRLTLSERESGKLNNYSLENNSILKWWPKNPSWIFAGASIPYKYAESGAAQSEGIGDISLLLGPRFVHRYSFGSLHYSIAGGVRLPTGDADAKPSLGSGSIDYMLNAGFTYLTPDKQFNVDAAGVFTFAGKDRNHRSDNVFTGAVLGAKPTSSSSLRAFAGPIVNYQLGGNNDGNYRVSLRTGVRFTPVNTKRWHIEGWADNDIASCNTPEGISGTLVFRYNFGKVK